MMDEPIEPEPRKFEWEDIMAALETNTREIADLREWTRPLMAELKMLREENAVMAAKLARYGELCGPLPE